MFQILSLKLGFGKEMEAQYLHEIRFLKMDH